MAMQSFENRKRNIYDNFTLIVVRFQLFDSESTEQAEECVIWIATEVKQDILDE